MIFPQNPSVKPSIIMANATEGRAGIGQSWMAWPNPSTVRMRRAHHLILDTNPRTMASIVPIFGPKPRSFDPNLHPFGVNLHSFGAKLYPFGANPHTFGVNRYTFGANLHTFGVNRYTFDANLHTFGAKPHPFGAKLQSFGSAPPLFNRKTTLSGHRPPHVPITHRLSGDVWRAAVLRRRIHPEPPIHQHIPTSRRRGATPHCFHGLSVV
jgi:hypothetical protein